MWPLPIRAAKMVGAATPPTSWEIAKKKVAHQKMVWGSAMYGRLYVSLGQQLKPLPPYPLLDLIDSRLSLRLPAMGHQPARALRDLAADEVTVSPITGPMKKASLQPRFTGSRWGLSRKIDAPAPVIVPAQ